MIDGVVAERSMLFLGSGFSLGATNRIGKSPPTGGGLKYEIAKKVGVDPTEYSLSDLAEYFGSNDSGALYGLVNDLFRIEKVSQDQKCISVAPWLRIYTTNFDDAVEVARYSVSLPVKSFTFSQEKPRKIDPTSIIHLHGTIREVAPDNALEKVVLGEAAYVRQHLESSPWYDQFLYDLRFCEKCFFIGYSLADQHIAALLTKDPRWRGKIHFVEPDRIPDKIFAQRVEGYGEIEPIGVDGFAELTKNRRAAEPISDYFGLKSFKLLQAQPDRKSYVKPTVSEVRDFLTHGDFDPTRLVSSLPEPTYAIPRTGKVQEAADAIKGSRTLFVDGRLGNGKSVFQYILFSKLAERGENCVVLKNAEKIGQSDLDFLASRESVVVIIPNFTDAQLALEALGVALPNAKFIVEARTSLLDIRTFEIQAIAPKPVARVSLNSLTDSDVNDFRDLCRSAGIPLKGLPHSPEMRDLVIQVFNSEAIRSTIKRDLEIAFAEEKTRKAIILVFLLQLMQARIDTNLMRGVLGFDPFEPLALNAEGVEEVVSTRSGGLSLHSSVFAEFAMREFVPTDQLLNMIHDCAVYCANRKNDRYLRNLLTAFMQYSKLRPLLNLRGNAEDDLRSLYERLRWYPQIEDEPLFWLQFGILEIDDGKLGEGKTHLDFAYERASERKKFKPYQIDTQYFRLVLDSIDEGYDVFDGQTVEVFEKYALKILAMMFEDSHRSFAFKLLERLPSVLQNLKEVEDNDKARILRVVDQAFTTSEALTPSVRSHYGFDVLLEKLKVTRRLFDLGLDGRRSV